MYAIEHRHRLKTALLILMALASLAGLSGCSSSDEAVEPNPSYDPAAGTVNALFALNFSTGTSPTTRMSIPNTQADGSFRGITDAKLLTYELRDGENLDNGKFVSTATNATNIFSLDNITGINAADASRVTTLNLKVNTNTVMFYGKASKTDGQDKQQGLISYNVSTTPSDTKFQLQPRLTNVEDVTARYTSTTTALAGILNEIIGVSYVQSEPASIKTWKNYYDDYIDPSKVSSMTALEKDLAKAYKNFYEIPSGEARSGSGSAVLRMVSDLMKVVTRIKDSTDPSGASEGVVTKNALVRHVAQAIIDKLVGTTTPSVIEGLFDYNTETKVFSYKEAQTALPVFPTNFNLPMGAAQLEYSGSGSFQYKSSAELAYSSDNNAVDINKIMWPAELCYYGNSPVKTTTVAKETDDYPSALSDWNNASYTKWTDFTGDHVENATRAVAMTYPVNYGTALLETTVQYGAADLEDNNATLHIGETANVINAATGIDPSPFELTGVLVGGQYSEMGWNFLRTTSAALCTIYDNDIVDGTIPAYDTSKTAANQSASSSNYTLVFDNYVVGAGSQNDVYVCLEFKNNSGKDFYGNKNLIGAGETFYLIGKLQLAGTSFALSDDQQTLAKVTAAIPRVFIQDYKTKAKFVIGANSLKYAFVTVPDLRASEITLGLAVDLTWETGPVFDGNDHNGIILGGN